MGLAEGRAARLHGARQMQRHPPFRIGRMGKLSQSIVRNWPMLLKKASYFWSRRDSVAFAGLVMETRDDG